MQLMSAKATRRQAILLLGATGIASLHATADTPKSGTKIHQEVDFQVPPSRIYEVLLDAKQFTKVTGHPAEIQPQAGGSLKMFGGLIEGRNIELDPNRRIVQAWREASWPPGNYTLVKLNLLPRGSGTHLVFDQTGIAEPDWGHLNEGWPIRYWEPLRKYFKS
jgi:activator of HSP90 ATPase